MITHTCRFFPLSLAVLILLPFAATRAQQAPPAINGPQVLDVQDGKIRVVPVATGLFHPWSLAFVDARTILVTERNGRIRMIRDGVLAPEPVWTSPTPLDQGADSLHFIAIHPKFAQNQGAVPLDFRIFGDQFDPLQMQTCWPDYEIKP